MLHKRSVIIVRAGVQETGTGQTRGELLTCIVLLQRLANSHSTVSLRALIVLKIGGCNDNGVIQNEFKCL